MDGDSRERRVPARRCVERDGLGGMRSPVIGEDAGKAYRAAAVIVVVFWGLVAAAVVIAAC